jgi:hypothetical protein
MLDIIAARADLLRLNGLPALLLAPAGDEVCMHEPRLRRRDRASGHGALHEIPC